jgi:hypothetical protein
MGAFSAYLGEMGLASRTWMERKGKLLAQTTRSTSSSRMVIFRRLGPLDLARLMIWGAMHSDKAFGKLFSAEDSVFNVHFWLVYLEPHLGKLLAEIFERAAHALELDIKYKLTIQCLPLRLFVTLPLVWHPMKFWIRTFEWSYWCLNI